MYLNPPSSCYQQTSRSLVFTSFPDLVICPIASAKPHRLLLANPQSFMTMGEGRRRGYNDFLLRMSSSLSKRWVCCVIKNLYRVFLFELASHTFVGMRVYIVWVKGNEGIYSFVGISRVGSSRETLAKLTAWHDSSASSMCFSCAIFGGTFICELLAS